MLCIVIISKSSQIFVTVLSNVALVIFWAIKYARNIRFFNQKVTMKFFKLFFLKVKYFFSWENLSSTPHSHWYNNRIKGKIIFLMIYNFKYLERLFYTIFNSNKQNLLNCLKKVVNQWMKRKMLLLLQQIHIFYFYIHNYNNYIFFNQWIII